MEKAFGIEGDSIGVEHDHRGELREGEHATEKRVAWSGFVLEDYEALNSVLPGEW